jgi:pyruvate/2-oxoglutarate dehydrogenase complex dihydrolipoamide acyltransferase (E2) component
MAWTESVGFIDSIALSLTCDHQIIDGAPGARFLEVVRKKIESVETILRVGESPRSGRVRSAE